MLPKEVLVNCDQGTHRRYCTPSSRLLLFSSAPRFCQFLEGSLLLNRILSTMTTKQSCFISAANDLAPELTLSSWPSWKTICRKNTHAQIGMHELIHTETLVIASTIVQALLLERVKKIVHANETKCGFHFVLSHF